MNRLALAFLVIALTGCMQEPEPLEGQGTTTTVLETGTGNWPPVGDFSWQTLEQDGGQTIMTREMDGASMDFIAAFSDNSIGDLVLSDEQNVIHIDGARLVSWHIEVVGDEHQERIRFEGA